MSTHRPHVPEGQSSGLTVRRPAVTLKEAKVFTMPIIKTTSYGARWIAYKHFFRAMIGEHSGFTAYFSLDGNHYLNFRLGTDYSEVEILKFGPFTITRNETEEEKEEREYGEAEQAYQDWCADFYSY